LAGWPGGHVGEGERVHDRPVLDWEGGQLVLQLTLLGLESRSGMVRDQAGQSLLAVGPQEQGAVDRMEAKPVERGSVADVVQVGGGHKYIAIHVREDHGHAPSCIGDHLDVYPPVAQRSNQLFCLRLCPRFQRHGATLPCLLDRAQGRLVGCIDGVR
jgi:hypothetical protein